MPLENFSISIPCKRYIAKYYTTLYGHPFDLSAKSHFREVLLMKLNNDPIRKLSTKDLVLALSGMDSQIKFNLPIDLFYRINDSINDQRVWNINRCLVDSFYEDLLITINVAAIFGVERRTSIETFANKYNIILEEDITYEALKKSEYRHRKNSNFKNLFLAELSSSFKYRPYQ